MCVNQWNTQASSLVSPSKGAYSWQLRYISGAFPHSVEETRVHLRLQECTRFLRVASLVQNGIKVSLKPIVTLDHCDRDAPIVHTKIIIIIIIKKVK